MRKTILTVLLLLPASGLNAQLVEYAYFDAKGGYDRQSQQGRHLQDRPNHPFIH